MVAPDSSFKRKRRSNSVSQEEMVSYKNEKPLISKHDLINVIMSNGNSDTIFEEDEELDQAQNDNAVASSDDEGDENDDDDENETDNEDASQDDENPTSRNVKKNDNSHVNNNDILLATETAELFRSNIFKLQIDELLSEIKLKEEKIQKVEKFLNLAYEIIENEIPDSEIFSIKDINKNFTNSSIQIPFPDPKPTNPNYKFQYLKPDSVSLIGSFGLKNGIKLPYNNVVDLNVVMPKSLFDKKDYLNYRCFYKRSFYLAYLSKYLILYLDSEKIQGSKNSTSFFKFTYEYINNDLLTPTLRIDCVPSSASENNYNFYSTKFSVRLIASFPYKLFDFKKLMPNRNNIKILLDNQPSSKLSDTLDTVKENNKNVEETSLPPTLIYNSSLITNSTYDHYLRFLYKTKKKVEWFSDACKLGKLWCIQRGLTNKGFGHFEFAIIMALLLKGGGINNGNKILLSGFSSYQLFKGTINYLANMDLCETGHLFFDIDSKDIRYIEESYNIPMIFDNVTRLNLLWKVTKYNYYNLQNEAKLTLNLLNNDGINNNHNDISDNFKFIFLIKNDLKFLKYDLCFRLPIPIIEFNAMEKITFISYENFIKNRLFTILKIGLKDKLKLIDISLNYNSNSNSIISSNFSKFTKLNKRKPELSYSNMFCEINLILNQFESEKLVIKGPSINDSNTLKINDFIEFWGGNSKTSIRKFKDNTIHHCIIWQLKFNEPIIYQIIKYLFNLHLDNFTGSKLSSNIKLFHEKLPISSKPGFLNSSITNLQAYNALTADFNDLFKLLLSLNDKLPLRIKNLTANSNNFRFTSLLLPVPFKSSNVDFFNNCILEFETSKNWPNEINALEITKTAFLVKICELLSSLNLEYKTFLEKDDSVPLNEHIHSLKIITPSGFGFKINALTPMDEVLYYRSLTNCPKEKLPLLEKTYFKFQQQYLINTKLTRLYTTLSFQHLFLSPCVRLFKKWLDSQYLLCHFSEELLDLICLQPFVNTGVSPWLPPSSLQNGFLKILYFISSWNWIQDPLILQLGRDESSYSKDDVQGNNAYGKISLRENSMMFETFKTKYRKFDPNGVNYQFLIGCPRLNLGDEEGYLYGSPVEFPIALRLSKLCKIAINLIEKEFSSYKSIVDGEDGSSQSKKKTVLDLLFTPSFSDYDIVIDCKQLDKLDYGILTSENKFKNLSMKKDDGNAANADLENDLNSKSNPILKLVERLNKTYKNVILFSTRLLNDCNDAERSDVIHHGNKRQKKNGSSTCFKIVGIFYPNVLQLSNFKINIGYNFKVIDGDRVVINKDAILNEILTIGGDAANDGLIEGIRINPRLQQT